MTTYISVSDAVCSKRTLGQRAGRVTSSRIGAGANKQVMGSQIMFQDESQPYAPLTMNHTPLNRSPLGVKANFINCRAEQMNQNMFMAIKNNNRNNLKKSAYRGSILKPKLNKKT